MAKVLPSTSSSARSATCCRISSASARPRRATSSDHGSTAVNASPAKVATNPPQWCTRATIGSNNVCMAPASSSAPALPRVMSRSLSAVKPATSTNSTTARLASCVRPSRHASRMGCGSRFLGMRAPYPNPATLRASRVAWRHEARVAGMFVRQAAARTRTETCADARASRRGRLGAPRR
jgi:hypothetical protein